MRTALTIAGSDSIGGAGIQADIKAMAAVGVHATSVITAITAQNTCSVSDIFAVPADMVYQQLDAVLKDCDIRAIKTGMLYSEEIVDVIVDVLEDHEVPLIVDPVMIATVGASLKDDGLVKALKKKLIPICELVTPNKHEAEELSGMDIRNEDDAKFACEIIGKEGSSVLLKGGHMDTKNVTDYLYLSSTFNELVYPRLNKAGHGSGCILSSYITAHMTKGFDLMSSVVKSREMIQQSINTQYQIGEGELIVNPMSKEKKDSGRFKILEELDVVADKLTDILPHELVPKDGLNIAYSLPNAVGPEDIAAIDKRMIVHNGMLVKGGQAKYGSAEHLSYVLIEIMKKFPDVRCVLNISSSNDIIDIIEEIGMETIKYNTKGQPTVTEMTMEALEDCDDAPDVILDPGKKNGKPMLKFLGKNPQDVYDKLDSVL